MTARLAFVAAAALVLTACGRAPLSANQAVALRTQNLAAASAMVPPAETRAVPPQSAFRTVEATVTKVLPEDNSGLTHQNFVVTTERNEVYTVNNSTTHGTAVAGLAVGLKLRIRGTVYKNGNRQGLHWTHKASKPGDAGWIETMDGRRFE